MPSKSEKQKKFMTIASKDTEFAKKNHIDPKVAAEFHQADKKEDQKKQPKKTKSMNSTGRTF